VLQLQENEKIILVLHKHWFDLARPAIIFLISILLPPVVLSFLPLFSFSNEPEAEPVINFFLALYMASLVGFFFSVWLDYYLDMWIITTRRIIDIEQYGLFRRETAEIPLEHVQDVTIDIQGVMETILKFGTLKVQTAGEREFVIHNVPRLYEAKDAIINGAQALRRELNVK